MLSSSYIHVEMQSVAVMRLANRYLRQQAVEQVYLKKWPVSVLTNPLYLPVKWARRWVHGQ